MTEELLDINQAAQLLNISPWTLRKWSRANKIKSVKIGTRGDRRYDRADLEEFIRKGKEHGENISG